MDSLNSQVGTSRFDRFADKTAEVVPVSERLHVQERKQWIKFFEVVLPVKHVQ